MDLERGDVKINVNVIVKSLLNHVREHNATNEIPAYIRKAPSTLRKHSPSSFTPRVVSIGPLHRKDKNLQRFEGIKAGFVHNLLSRSGTLSEHTLTECVEKVASIIKDIRSCYDAMKDYKDNELAEMMVMDACFILQFIHKISSASHLTDLSLQDQYICYDLVLLENQIPFFLLKSIYECFKHEFDQELGPEFILPLVQKVKLFEGPKKVVLGSGPNTKFKYDHILGYLHHCYRPTYDIPLRLVGSTIHSAVELDTAGVNFKPYNNPEWPMAMEVTWKHSGKFFFRSKPTLLMPTLRIDDFTELVFRNLIAYEQSYEVHPYVTSYARAMNMLIDTDDDVSKLVSSEVIVNHIGSNYEAADMINGICKEVAPDYFCYSKQWEELDIHFKGGWPKRIVKLRRTYFHSPWSAIAVFAAFVLFILALLQTIFTIKSP